MTTIVFINSGRDRLRAAALRLSRLWHSYPREMLGVALISMLAAVALATSITRATNSTRPQPSAPPPPPPMLVKPIAPADAIQLNASIPVAIGANPAARPFVLKGSAAARTQALNCLASAVYYEAGNQDVAGERAVAQVVLNRVRHPAFPASVCGVVYQGSTKPTGCQFTFTCDGSLSREPDADGWLRAKQVASAALAGYVCSPVGWATHYHADYVVPVWASSMAKNAVIGAHLFYRWGGTWGQPAVFTQAYAGREPNADTLRAAALAAPHVKPVYGEDQLAKVVKDIPGAEPLKLTPSLRGDKRVAVRFNLTARKASDDVKQQDYSKEFQASENLKWSLSEDPVGVNERPLGRSAPAAAAAATGPRSASEGSFPPSRGRNGASDGT